MSFLRRFSAFCLAALMTVSSAAVLSTKTEATLYKKGDANCDTSVNAEDELIIRKSVAGYDEVIESDGADIDADGKITSKDAFYIKAQLSGSAEIDENFPEGYGWNGFTVSGKSVDGFFVVVTNPDNPNMVFAADELCKYLKNGDGSSLTVVNEVPEEGNFFMLREGDFETYGNDGVNILVEDGNVYLTGGALRGTMYAVYTLLKDYYGYRFWGYDEISLDKDRVSDVPEGTNDTQIPEILTRCNCINPFGDRYLERSDITNRLSGCTGQWSMLKAKYGYGIQRLLANAHSFDVFISKEDRHCLSNAENFEICLENMSNLISDRIQSGMEIGKDITQISCSYSAYEDYCNCRFCSATLTGGRIKVSGKWVEYQAEGSYAGILVQFVNKIDDALTEMYPGITVITNAYGIVRKPPKVSVLNDDVVLLYCWNACTNHEIGSGLCTGRYVGENMMGSNLVEEEFFAGWKEHCSRFIIWYYPTNIYYLLCPEPNFFKIYSDFEWFRNQGVEGYYVVGTKGSGFEDMEAYLINQLMWSDMTYEQFEDEMKEYLRARYGYGWVYIYDYMKMLRASGDLKSCVLNDYEHPFDIYSREYFADNFDKMQELFDKALALCETDGERFQVEWLSIHMKFLGYSATYDRDYVNGDAASRAEFEAGWRAVYDYINQYNVMISYDQAGIPRAFTIDKSPMMLVYGIEGER